MFNIVVAGSTAASYWAIIVPLMMSVDLLNDSFARQARENVAYTMSRKAKGHKYDESKANST